MGPRDAMHTELLIKHPTTQIKSKFEKPMIGLHSEACMILVGDLTIAAKV